MTSCGDEQQLDSGNYNESVLAHFWNNNFCLCAQYVSPVEHCSDSSLCSEMCHLKYGVEAWMNAAGLWIPELVTQLDGVVHVHEMLLQNTCGQGVQSVRAVRNKKSMHPIGCNQPCVSGLRKTWKFHETCGGKLKKTTARVPFPTVTQKFLTSTSALRYPRTGPCLTCRPTVK